MRLKDAVEADLSAKSIDGISEQIISFLEKAGENRRNCLRVSLYAEELLLRMQERFGSDARVSIFLEAGLRRPQIRIEANNKPFNPLNEPSEEAFGEWNDSLITAVGLNSKYAYSGGTNTLRIVIPGSKMNPVLKMLIAIAAGALFGVIGRLALPDVVASGGADSVLEPLIGLWTTALSAMSGPVMFFMVVTTMLNTKSISRRGGNSVHVIARYFLASLLMTASALFVSSPFLSEVKFSLALSTESMNEAKSFLLGLIPGNIFSPFLDVNTPQLFVLAFLLGGALLALAEKVSTLSKTIRQINMVGLILAKWISKLVPYVIGVVLCLEIWSSQAQVLLGMWMPLVLAAACSVIIVFVVVFIFSKKMKVGLALLAKKLRKPFLNALKSGCLEDIMDDVTEACVRRLGIDAGYARDSLPQGIVLFMPVSAIGTLIFTTYAAVKYSVVVTPFWSIAALVLAVVLFAATPPVPGANLLAYIVLFNLLGIPGEAIINAMIFDVIFGIFASAANLTLLQAEIGFQAHRLGMLNTDRLRKA